MSASRCAGTSRPPARFIDRDGPRRRGICPECGRVIAVRVNGGLFQHTVSPGTYRYGTAHGRLVDNKKHPLDTAKCGTRNNYAAHRRRGQKPCRRCTEAEGGRLR